ncbi:hypothetical protein AMTRI_Chr01g108970 [Amborella trichopoda]
MSWALEREEVPKNACSYTVKIKRAVLWFLILEIRSTWSSGTFEKCSIDTFKLRGSCSYRICLLYLNRYGHDGWRPKWVQVCKPRSDTIVSPSENNNK